MQDFSLRSKDMPSASSATGELAQPVVTIASHPTVASTRDFIQNPLVFIMPITRTLSGCAGEPASGSAHGNQFFSARGVNRHRVIEILLGGAHAHRHRKPLHHLIGANSGHMTADYLLVRPRRDQFHPRF